MALAHSPRIVTDGLVLCLDAGNLTKGLNLSQNYFPYSEDITTQTGGWTSTAGGGFDYGGTGIQAVITANYGIAPDGTQTADRIQLDKGVGTGTTDRSGIRYALSMVGRTLSYHIKFLDDTTITGFVTSVYPQGSTFTYDTLSNDWYRVKISGSTSLTCRIQYIGSTAVKNTLDALIWGIQLEDGSNATDYVKTTGTSKTNSRALNDLSGNSGIGTLINGVGYTSSNGGSLSFDGVNHYISLGSNTTLKSIGSEATIECWFKSSSVGTSNYAVLVGWGDGNLYYSNFGIGNWGSFSTQESIYLGYNTNVVCYATGGNALYHDGNWHHAVTTIGSNKHKIYVDGVELNVTFEDVADSYSVSNIFGFTSTTTVDIGRRPYNGGTGYNSENISSVKIYNRALTAAEVQQNFNALRGRYGI